MALYFTFTVLCAVSTLNLRETVILLISQCNVLLVVAEYRERIVKHVLYLYGLKRDRVFRISTTFI